MAEFIVESGNSVSRMTFTEEKVSIGRNDDNSIVLDDGKVSRYHAVVRRGRDGWIVEDLGSGNGTFIEGTRVLKVSIDRGSSIQIGDANITFLGVSGPSTDDAAAPLAASGVAKEGEPEPETGAAMAASAPEIEGYESVELLGSGLYSQVYSYRHTASGTLDAVRVLNEGWCQTDGFSSWLEESLAAWSRTDHPGLARIDLMRDTEGRPVLRERMADEGTLLDRLAKTKRFDQKEAIEIVLHIGRAVAYLHQMGIEHGGIHPSRIRVYSDGQPRLAGPGFLRQHLEHVPDSAARHLSCLAPEGVVPDGVMGRRSDIYSLGSLLHHLLVGAPVGEGNSKEGVIRSIQKGLYKKPQERRPDLIEGLSDLIEACVATDPTERPLSMGEFLERLEPLKGQSATRARSRPEQMQGRERDIGERQQVHQKSLRHRTLSYTITALIIIIVNGGLYILLFEDYGSIFSSGSGNDQLDDGIDPSRRTESSAVDELRRNLKSLLDRDGFQDASWRLQQEAQAGKIDGADATNLGQMIERRKRIRVDQLNDEVETGINEGIQDRARKALNILGVIVGIGDPEYQRLKKRVEAM